jgi:predicted Zn-dependent protease
LAVLAGLALLIPFGRSRTELATARRQTVESILARHETEARQRLAAWSAREPRSGEVEYHRAWLEVAFDHPAEALDAMRRAVSLGYPEEPVLVLRAVLLARAGQFAEAEPVLARAMVAGTEPRAEVAEGLSRIYLKSFRLAETIQALEVWMKVAPEDPRPYLRRNEVDERINADPAVLIRNYREALRRDPTLIDARLGLAEKLRETSNFDEAEVEYAALLERDPRNLRGLVGAGRVALLKGDLTAAAKAFEDAIAINPREKVALRELGLIDLNGGRIPQACERLKAAVEADPYDPEVRYSYARTLKAAGQTARAAEETAATEQLKKEQEKMMELRQALVERPDDVDLRCRAARWLIEHGHEKEGLEWTGLILRQKPGHAATCRLLAEYYGRKGDTGLANYYRLAETPGSAP